jgi:hypothetical protein
MMWSENVSLYAIKTMTKEFIFHCVAISDDDWMLWNFHHRQQDITELSIQVPLFHDAHHVRVKMLAEQVFFRCACLLYER